MAERTLQSDPASTDFDPATPFLFDDAAARPRAGNPYLFEVSWEVCNQVGGIYQVIRSKAPLMTQRWGDQYYCVGPWEEAKATLEYEECRPVPWIARALLQLEQQGLKVRHGTWLVPGRPKVMLIEHWQGREALDRAKYKYWREHAIETPGQDWLIDGVMSFTDAVFRLFEALCEHRPVPGGRSQTHPLVGHFHEWLGGLAIPELRRRKLPVATIFTTHATLLGRYIASSRENFYDHLPWMDQEAEARNFNVTTQHRIERACAHGAHVFTTVSSVTAEECSVLLGRPVDVVLPNGLTVGLYNAGHEQQRLHGEYKEALHRFTMGHFFPSYSFDLDKTLYMFTSGRYEPRNKGFDLCLEAMARLNAQMKHEKIDKKVVFFVVTKRATKSINPLAMEKRGVLNELNEVCQHIVDGVGKRLFSRAASGGRLRMDDLIDEYWMLRYKRAQHALKQHCMPMVVTHILEDVRGCHLGLFPSMYEPWGYTPLECLAMGVPAITSDVAGFGRFVMENFADSEKWGMTIVRRRGKSYHDAASSLANSLMNFCRLERRDRIALRNEVDRHSWEFDWSKLGRAYHASHDLALARYGTDVSGGIAMVSAAQLAGQIRADGGAS
jgi:glycogen(starch) synthase